MTTQITLKHGAVDKKSVFIGDLQEIRWGFFWVLQFLPAIKLIWPKY